MCVEIALMGEHLVSVSYSFALIWYVILLQTSNFTLESNKTIIQQDSSLHVCWSFTFYLLKFLRKTFLTFNFTQSSSFLVPTVGYNLSDTCSHVIGLNASRDRIFPQKNNNRKVIISSNLMVIRTKKHFVLWISIHYFAERSRFVAEYSGQV